MSTANTAAARPHATARLVVVGVVVVLRLVVIPKGGEPRMLRMSTRGRGWCLAGIITIIIVENRLKERFSVETKKGDEKK